MRVVTPENGPCRAGRVAALYDIHGNLPALEAVLADLRREDVDLVVVGGDVVPGPMPRQTMSALLEIDVPVRFITGNGERETLAALAGEDLEGVPPQLHDVLRWVAADLTGDQVRMVERWPATLRVTIVGLGEVLFCHATPRSDSEIFTRVTPEERLRPIFEPAGVPLVVCGHTHMRFDRSVGDVRIINAGSVGMPFEKPGAYWLLMGPRVEVRRSSYDLDGAAGRIRATDYPLAEGFATEYVLQPPAEETMLEVFERAALR